MTMQSRKIWRSFVEARVYVLALKLGALESRKCIANRVKNPLIYHLRLIEYIIRNGKDGATGLAQVLNRPGLKSIAPLKKRGNSSMVFV